MPHIRSPGSQQRLQFAERGVVQARAFAVFPSTSANKMSEEGPSLPAAGAASAVRMGPSVSCEGSAEAVAHVAKGKKANEISVSSQKENPLRPITLPFFLSIQQRLRWSMMRNTQQGAQWE